MHAKQHTFFGTRKFFRSLSSHLSVFHFTFCSFDGPNFGNNFKKMLKINRKYSHSMLILTILIVILGPNSEFG